jgi:hypothetical protein
MLCDTSVDPKSTGMSLVQYLVLSSLRALCAGSLGRRCLRVGLSDEIRGLPAVRPRVPRAYRSASGRSERLSSWGAVALLP